MEKSVEMNEKEEIVRSGEKMDGSLIGLSEEKEMDNVN